MFRLECASADAAPYFGLWGFQESAHSLFCWDPTASCSFHRSRRLSVRVRAGLLMVRHESCMRSRLSTRPQRCTDLCLYKSTTAKRDLPSRPCSCRCRASATARILVSADALTQGGMSRLILTIFLIILRYRLAMFPDLMLKHIHHLGLLFRTRQIRANQSNCLSTPISKNVYLLHLH